MKRLFCFSLLILIFVGDMGLGALRSEAWNVPDGLQSYRVIRVVDGDTIELEKLGKARYIGINTPETKHPSKGVEYFGPEAYEANRRLVAGKRVRIGFDAGKQDRYGRYLVYAYTGSTFVNAYLVEAGYAQVMTVPPNVQYADLFVQLQREARANGRGLWGARPLDSGKSIYWGSVNSNKFHWPSCEWARKIREEHRVVFKTRQEALDKGYTPCKVCKP